MQRIVPVGSDGTASLIIAFIKGVRVRTATRRAHARDAARGVIGGAFDTWLLSE